jgi:type I restriction enzyme R subunit
MLCLENLFIYLDFVAYCYSDKYEEHDFNKSIIEARIDRAKQSRRDEAAVKEKLVQKQDCD